MADLSQLSDAELQAMYAQPRGLRNNNPLNLKATVPWNGMAGTDGPFATFGSMDEGMAAADRNLQTYGTKHGINTVAGVVNRWAPPNADGNNTGAYTQHVASKVGVDPNAPIDLVNPETRQALLGAMAEFENGQPLPQAAAPAGDLSALSNEDLMALYQTEEPPTAAPARNPMVRPPQIGADPPANLRADDGLGFLKGAFKPIDNAARGLESVIRGSGAEGPLAAAGRGLRSVMPDGLVNFIDDPQGYYDAQAKRGVRPGKLGEFAGNVAGTLPLAAIPGGVVAQGAAGGALLSDADDAGGVVRDAAVGAVAGAAADKGLKLLGKGAQAVLGKMPQTMTFAELEAAKKAAYAKVDAAGFKFKKADAQALASDIEALVTGKGGKALYGDAWAWAQHIKTLANQKGGLPLSQLEDARGTIYTELVKPGGKGSTVGQAIRQKIDNLIAKEASQNTLLREARELNSRFAKAGAVMKRLESADLQAGRAYTGKNVNNAIRQKLSPLIDPMSPQRLRNATPDEAKALKKAVVGSKGQNLVRTAGTMLDPRGVIGMGLQATGAAKTGMLSLASVPVGLLATAAGNRMSQKNVEELVRLIAAGGSKAALTKQATPASRAAAAAVKKVRPATGLIGAAAAAQSRGQ